MTASARSVPKFSIVDAIAQCEDLFERYGGHSQAARFTLRRGNLPLSGIPQIKPPFLDIAPAGIPPNIMPHSKGVKCGLIHSKSPLSLGNHCTAKRKSPKPLVYAQVSPLGSPFALCDPVTVTNPDAPKVD